MDDSLEKLTNYYENEGLEDARLQEDSVHYTEFLTITKYLNKTLAPHSKILDPCAGTGIYSFYLSDTGHMVTAGDLMEINVLELYKKNKANKKSKLKEIYKGNILDLSKFADNTFDCVLCMGALYHLMDEYDRLLAISESLRVLKKGGLLVATYINRYGVIACNFYEDVDDIDEILSFLENGKLDVFYSEKPSNIEKIFSSFPVEKLYHIGADGIGYLLYKATTTITYKGLLNWRRYHLATCEEYSLLGYSYHGAYFCLKK